MKRTFYIMVAAVVALGMYARFDYQEKKAHSAQDKTADSKSAHVQEGGKSTELVTPLSNSPTPQENAQASAGKSDATPEVKMARIEGVWSAGNCKEGTYEIFEVRDKKRWYTMCPFGRPSREKDGCLSTKEIVKYYEGSNEVQINTDDGDEMDYMFKDSNTMRSYHAKIGDRLLIDKGQIAFGPATGRETGLIYRCM